MADARIEIRTDERPAGIVATVIVDNPRRLNTLNSALLADLVRAMEQLARLDRLRVVVLTGAGEKAFIAGADIGEMSTLRDPRQAAAFITKIHACGEAIRSLAVPVIARVNGFAFGAGLEIAASCDLRIAARTALFGMPEVKLGIPSVVEAALLPALVGWGRARRLLLLGERIDATTAETWGLVEAVAAPGALDGMVEEWVGHLLDAGPRAIRLQKRLIRAWEDLPLRAAIAAGIECFASAFETDEPRTALSGFLAARARAKAGR